MAALVLGGILIRTNKAARIVMLTGIPLCILCTSVFFLPPCTLWTIALLACSAFAGASFSAWGHFFKNHIKPGQRYKTVISILIIVAVLKVLINVTAIYISTYIGLAFSVAILTVSWFFVLRVPENECPVQGVRRINRKKGVASLSLITLFIVVITIDSGIMVKCIQPAYQELDYLSPWFWILPYTAALFMMRNLKNALDRNNMLYVAIGMIGLAYILFLMTEPTWISYVAVYSLMMAGWAVCILFWWGILGEMLEWFKNPAFVLGLGFSANMLGVLHGNIIGMYEMPIINNRYVFALGIVCITLIILPVMHKSIAALLESSAGCGHIINETKMDLPAVTEYMNELTDREKQIAELLLKGRTCKLIAAELYVSENTVKTHVKNIYSKLGVQKKSDLFKRMIR
jgi:DNA-binding CsgD family transcriptional regulator